MPRLFGTSGVRGLVNGKLTSLTALKLGLAFAAFLGNEGTVGVVSDARLASPILKMALIAGLANGGINVIDFGTASTPGLLHAVKRRGLSGGVAVTGSHTPPEIHGILFFRSDTAELYGDYERKLERVFEETRFSFASWTKTGSVSRSTPLRDYVLDILESFSENEFRGYKIVLDAGHSPAVSELTEILERLGCKVFVLNGKVDGRFPNRPPNPLPEYLSQLRKAVTSKRADFGLAIDGDGDRAVFVDEKGHVVTPDYAGAIFADEELASRAGGVVVCPVNTSRVIEYVVRRHRARCVYTRIGPPAMVEAILKHSGDVVFAFEETGKYIWPGNIYYGDPAYASARLLSIVSEKSPLSELAETLPQFYQEKLAVPCPDEAKQAVLERLRAELERLEEVEVITIDGVKAVFPGGDWVLLRPSGTEPVFRCFVEASSPRRLDELRSFALRVLRKALTNRA